MEDTRITETLIEILETESKRFAGDEGTLKDAMEKFIEMGLDTTTSYNLPLKDTIGRTLYEQRQCKRR